MIVVVCIFFVSVFIATRYYLFGKNSEKLCRSFDEIPQPRGIPILGNVSDMFCNDDEIWKITRERALKYYPIYRLQVFNSNIVSLLHPEDIEQILGSTKHIEKGGMYNTLRLLTGNGLIVNNEKSWHDRRKLLTKSFHFSTLQAYVEIFSREAQILVKNLQRNANKCTELLEPISHCTMKIINEVLVGENLRLQDSDIKCYLTAIETISRIIGYKNSKPILSLVYNYSQLKKEEKMSLKLMHTFTRGVLRNSKMKLDSNPKLLDVMINAPNVYDEKNIKDEINTFLFAGNSTTSAGLLFSLLLLANHQEYQDELYQEMVQILEANETPSLVKLKSMNFLNRFLKECMRLFPPVPFIGRIIKEDMITKTGYRIPAGTAVVIHIFDVHRSPYIYDSPEIFDPDRFLPENSKRRHPFSYIPFSAGPRNCIAQKFATLEIKASICEILKQFKLEPVTLIEDVTFTPDVTLMPKENIKVKLISRS